MKISIVTLGCKVNFYESDAIKEELIKNGYDVVTGLEVADMYILNTCAVTNEAEKKSREQIAKLTKLNSKAKIIVCGCSAQHNQKPFLEKENVTLVIGNGIKNKIPQILTEAGNLTSILPTNYECFNQMSSSRTRAYLKIQDGCNNYCSYCLIPFVRGRSRSRDLADIIKEANELSLTNKEIVLTGINISDYKINNELALNTLMQELSKVNARIRIGSLEVNVITPELLTTLKNMPNFCPQFHLSMQSGSNSILKKMNRHYTKEEYMQKVDLIREYFPLASITTDVIVGFPTESQAELEETIETIKKIGFFKMHIFPYSKRNGTVAEKMQQLPNSLKKERVKILEELDNHFFAGYLLKMKNQTQIVLTEQLEDSFVIGHSENYIKCYLPANTPLNELVKVKVGEQHKDGVIAEIIK